MCMVVIRLSKNDYNPTKESMRQTDLISRFKIERWYRRDCHVIRDGSNRLKDTKCWVFYRYKENSRETNPDIGFRLVY